MWGPSSTTPASRSPARRSSLRWPLRVSRTSEAGRPSSGVTFYYYRSEVLEGSPLERLCVTKTDDHGTFSFECLPPNAWPRLAVITPDGRHMRVKPDLEAGDHNDRMKEEMGFVPIPSDAGHEALRFPRRTGSGPHHHQAAGREGRRAQGHVPVQPAPARSHLAMNRTSARPSPPTPRAGSPSTTSTKGRSTSSSTSPGQTFPGPTAPRRTSSSSQAGPRR